ncbi:hypothetical protein As57867_004246, partial [Aphanomyces stellatus]
MTPRATVSVHVLTSPSLLCAICAFQRSVPRDMLPLQRLPTIPAVARSAHEYFGQSERVVDVVVTPWLASHGFARLPRVVAYLPHVTSLLANFAADHGRVDLLTHLHDHIHVRLDGCSNILLELVARRGHVATLAYLGSVDYPLARLNEAVFFATSQCQQPVLVYVLATYGHTINMRGWVPTMVARTSTIDGDLSTMRWLVDVWFPAVESDEMYEALLTHCLAAAMDVAQVDVVHWVAAKIQARHGQLGALLEVFMLHSDNTDFLLDAMREDADVSLDELAHLAATNEFDEVNVILARLPRVFAKFTCLQVGGTKRRAALTACLRLATTC